MIFVINRASDSQAQPLTAMGERFEVEGFQWEHLITCSGKGGQPEIAVAKRLAEHLEVDMLKAFELDGIEKSYVWVSYSIEGKPGPRLVLRSAAGWYIGRTYGGMPYSRDSVRYWDTEAEAETALRTGAWERRVSP